MGLPQFQSMRARPRYRTNLTAEVSVGDQGVSCRLLDVSATGAGILIFPSMLSLLRGFNWYIDVKGLISAPATPVWRTADRAGLRFDITEQRANVNQSRLDSVCMRSDDIWLSSA